MHSNPEYRTKKGKIERKRRKISKQINKEEENTVKYDDPESIIKKITL